MGVPDPNQILNTNIYQQTLVSAFKDTVSESIGSGGVCLSWCMGSGV